MLSINKSFDANSIGSSQIPRIIKCVSQDILQNYQGQGFCSYEYIHMVLQGLIGIAQEYLIGFLVSFLCIKQEILDEEKMVGGNKSDGGQTQESDGGNTICTSSSGEKLFFFTERITFFNDKLTTKKKIVAHQRAQKKLHRPFQQHIQQQ